jgi:hypothetical protein
MSDIFWQALIGGAVTVVLAYMQLLTRRSMEERADRAVAKAEVVKNTLQTANARTAAKVAEVKASLENSSSTTELRLGEMKIVADQTHTLVNSAMGIQLQMHAETTRRIAEMTNHANDISDADAAEHALAEHKRKQTIADESKPTEKGNGT